MREALTALDATFLELEQLDEGAVMNIGGVMVFEGHAPTVEELWARLTGRLAMVPRYTQRLSRNHSGALAWPYWTHDDRFDVGAHVRPAALPAPGTDDDLCAWAADFYSHRLDRTRPLWEMALIEGLERGRWALAHKMHHCLADGVGSLAVARLLLDYEAGTDPGFIPAPRSETPLLSLMPDLPAPIAQAGAAGGRAARAGLNMALHPRDALARSRSVAQMIVRDEVLPAPPTSLNVPIGSSRRFAVVRIPMADLDEIRHALGGSINDAVLAACTTGLRALLLERGEQPPSAGLRAMVPVNIRTAAQAVSFGNHISSLFVALPVAEPADVVRHRKIVGATRRLKASSAGADASTIVDLAGLAPPILHSVIARSLYGTRLFNVTITNVPGAQTPQHAFGSRLRDVHPVVPLAADHCVGIAAFSCDGLMTLGVIADSESTPDIGVLAYGIEQGIETLLELARSRALQQQAK